MQQDQAVFNQELSKLVPEVPPPSKEDMLCDATVDYCLGGQVTLAWIRRAKYAEQRVKDLERELRYATAEDE